MQSHAPDHNILIHELLHVYTPSKELHSSVDTHLLKIPRSGLKAFGKRSFLHVGPSTWNDLPYIPAIYSDWHTSLKQAFNTFYVDVCVCVFLCMCVYFIHVLLCAPRGLNVILYYDR